jgi:hypothetical protein
MLVFNKYFYKDKKSKLCFGDRVAVLNDMFYEYGGSMSVFTHGCGKAATIQVICT